jgi:hypothetical protein
MNIPESLNLKRNVENPNQISMKSRVNGNNAT